jgi:hypothetical protein
MACAAPRPQPRPELDRFIDDAFLLYSEYGAYKPLTFRQIFYRLVAGYGYPKTEEAYAQLCQNLDYIFSHVPDDGVEVRHPEGFNGPEAFWDRVRQEARDYLRDRRREQWLCIEVWVGVAELAPQIAKVVHPYGVSVYSSDSFGGTFAKESAALRMANRSQQTIVLHVGDSDCRTSAIEADVVARVRERWGRTPPVFHQVTVTEEQIARFNLLPVPRQQNDDRDGLVRVTIEAEALPPDVLVQEVEKAVREHLDYEQWRGTVALEERERGQILQDVEKWIQCGV